MRRVWRKGASKDKVFGCDLLEHLNTSGQDVPQVLRCCSQFIEEHGIVDGIYRLSGVSSNIQKLRSEFESYGTPDLSKEVYLQDIHCVSSLCKAYFRELPNPLLTYQLYDKFAEAVAVQLEEERLVKIRDVLQELPKPHYRTLEFLMSHLVKMASYSSETNMHARNLAIVWAPNLLRSKDIEVSGFNGTAAFMEVRVQSIVVEFILTHVPQLFPEPGVAHVRRKSLPSPTAIFGQEESLFKAQPPANFGHISPGDGPLPMRPYHAIIEGTDKKGSFKGRKWMSIFNIGSRFQDPKRRHKHSAKEKERPVLRPARSMDSLSIPSYSNEEPIRPLQTSRSTKISGLEVSATPSPLSRSEYAVTYRRGTGLVSGGTQGTYTALEGDKEGGDNVGTKDIGRLELKVEEVRKAKKENQVVSIKKEIVLDEDANTLVDKEEEEKNEVPVKEDCRSEPAAEETHAESLNYHVDDDVYQQDPYEDMQGAAEAKSEDNVFASSDINSTDVQQQDDQELSGYIQDSFEFLDHMDCSISCQIPVHFLPDSSSQMNEFSVEPPGYSDDEYELMEQPLPYTEGPNTSLSTSPSTNDQNKLKSHRPPSVDANERHGKSLSLPYMTSPVCEPGECCTDDGDNTEDDDAVHYYSSDEESSLLATSLPADFFLSSPSDLEPDNVPASTAENVSVDESSEEMEFNPECCTAKQQNNSDKSQDDADVGENTIPQNEERLKDQEDKSLRNEDLIMKEAGPEPFSLEMPSNQCLDLAMQEHTDESSVDTTDDVAVSNVRQEEEVLHYSVSGCAQKETSEAEELLDVSEEVTASVKQDTDEGEDGKNTEDMNPETIGNLPKNLSKEENKELRSGKTQEEDFMIVWKELEEVVCELIEEEERKTVEGEYSEETNKIETIPGQKTEVKEMNSTERFDQVAEVVKMLVPEAPTCVEVEVTPSLEDTPLKKVRSDESESREGVSLDEKGPERCEQEGTVREKLVPEEDKPFRKEMSVTPTLRDRSLKEVRSDIQDSGEAMRVEEQELERCELDVTVKERFVSIEVKPISEELTVTPSLIDTPLKLLRPIVSGAGEAVTFEEQGPEKCEPEATVQENLLTEDEKPVGEEVTAKSSLRDIPLREIRSDIPLSGEDRKLDEQVPDRCEQDVPVKENLVPEEDKPICEEVIVTPSLRDIPLKEVRAEVPEIGEAMSIEEQGPEKCESDFIIKKTFVREEEKPICEEVTVTPSFRDATLKVVSSDVARSGFAVKVEEQGSERCDPEVTLQENLETENDKPICGELTVSLSIGDEPLKEDFPKFEEAARTEEQEPKWCEPEFTVEEKLVREENKLICEEVTVTPSRGDTPLKYVAESQENVKFEEQGLKLPKEECTLSEKLVPIENKPNCEEVIVTPSLRDTPQKDVRSDILEYREGMRFEDRGVGRKLVISKLPNVYQVKAVPIVPPKPQHCKLVARSLRQQQQQRERRDADTPDDVGATCGKDSPRNSPLSMCFDEAVAIATLRREKERESERERQRDKGVEFQ
ncbi:rho GTPase-activating protein 30 isoform X2 [Corythoichthys intestinalis]|uniref:rho GTPase-activating protein 30 isoform X2 n=1 Tax=Corythoichthys intestinalis TaxID=161448 RepID=UPI0025A4D58F|nr:rho GTPase-activating protein 30 isoform X2 [Corythoichthys intestinalis]